jgi:hypothetical protein
MHKHPATTIVGPLVAPVQVSLKFVPPSLKMLTLFSFFVCIKVGEYDQLRPGQHIQYTGYAMELVTRELGFDSWQGKGFFSSSLCSDWHLWFTHTPMQQVTGDLCL